VFSQKAAARLRLFADVMVDDEMRAEYWVCCAKTDAKAGYFDVINLWRRLRCPRYSFSALKTEACRAPGQVGFSFVDQA
jgi:hypothetical protein